MPTEKRIRSNLKVNPFVYTRAISIEPSNICNYSNIHQKCPLSKMKEKKIMPLRDIEKILIELSKYNYSGIIHPFNYSEPLIDPRFYTILDLIKKYIPKAFVSIYTNGFFLDEMVLDELAEHGMNRVAISLYDKKEDKRLLGLLRRIRANGGHSIELRAYRRYPLSVCMNNKIEWYDDEPINSKMPCSAPLSYLYINTYGDVVLCCHDWKSMHTFGSIYDSSLYDIINSDKVIDTYIALQHGERHKLHLCARCPDKHR
jgi:MoaA/NifB/PqqE/SkfB family radical SAM enzyme